MHYFIFRENKAQHFMRIVFSADNSHEMLSLISFYKNMSISSTILHSTLRAVVSIDHLNENLSHISKKNYHHLSSDYALNMLTNKMFELEA